MKKILIILILLISIISSCRYKEGPFISIHSVAKRLNGYWEITGFTSNGVDSLQNYNDSCGSKMHFSFFNPDKTPCDPKIGFNDGRKHFGGSLSFSENKKILNVNMFGPLSWSLGPIGNVQSNWKILKLTMQELKISTSLNDRNYEISFKKSSQ